MNRKRVKQPTRKERLAEAKKRVEAAQEAHAAAEDEAAYGAPGRKMTAAEGNAWKRWMERDDDRRARYGKLPKPPERGDVELLYSKLHEDLRHLNDGELVMTVVNTDAWQSTVGARCRELDAAASSRRAYTSIECETALLYQRLLGKRSYAAARKDLCSAEAAGVMTRATLGFDRPRDHVPNRYVKDGHRRKLDGVPSTATMSRYRRKRFPEAERSALYRECFMRMVLEHADRFPAFRQELRVLGFDGSVHKTVYTPGIVRDREGNPVVDEETGKVLLRVNGWEGGSRTAADSPASKNGHGFMTVTGHTGEGLPVSCRTVRLHDPEVECLLDAAEHDLPRIREHMEADDIGVCTLDGAYAGQRTRRALRKVGWLENTHHVGHGQKAATKRNLAKRLGSASKIEDAPNWRANGLRHIFCLCGEGETYARPRMLAEGRVSVSTECVCPTCGNASFTAGDYRLAQNPSRYVLINPRDNVDVEDADLLFGNPLHRGDKRAKAYGNNRYAQGEGLHGTTTTRWNLFKDRAYYKRVAQPELDVLLTYCLMHGLAMETRRQQGQAELPPPTPLPRAASPPPAELAA